MDEVDRLVEIDRVAVVDVGEVGSAVVGAGRRVVGRVDVIAVVAGEEAFCTAA